MAPLHLLFFFLFSGLCLLGQSEARAASDSVEISAEESLEWYQDTKLYVARGKAKAIRGGRTVEADILTAHQREGSATMPSHAQKQSNGDIDHVTAEGNVHIRDAEQEAFGQKAVYDVDSGQIKITGNNLKLITHENIVTAKESLNYDDPRGVAVARGRALGEHGGNRVEADLLIARFAPMPAGGKTISTLMAKGNVIVTTKDGGVSRGNEAVYDIKKDSAVLSGNVRIARGSTQLAGEKALINFATGQSRLISDGTGRVRALLPSSGHSSSTKAP